VGIVPSLLTRNSLPRRVVRLCELLVTVFSPTPTYSLPSLPNCMPPPLCFSAGAFSRSIKVSGDGLVAATSPLAT
jgi:hypothetical protein